MAVALSDAKSKESLFFFNFSLKTGHILESVHLNPTAYISTQLALILLTL